MKMGNLQKAWNPHSLKRGFYLFTVLRLELLDVFFRGDL